jgi:hypothetical protein
LQDGRVLRRWVSAQRSSIGGVQRLRRPEGQSRT